MSDNSVKIIKAPRVARIGSGEGRENIRRIDPDHILKGGAGKVLLERERNDVFYIDCDEVLEAAQRKWGSSPEKSSPEEIAKANHKAMEAVRFWLDERNQPDENDILPTVYVLPPSQALFSGRFLDWNVDKFVDQGALAHRVNKLDAQGRFHVDIVGSQARLEKLCEDLSKRPGEAPSKVYVESLETSGSRRRAK